MTIRRDLETLARAGLIEKVHGGAVLPGSPSSHEPGFEAKSVLGQPQKEAIARAAAELVTPGTAIALSAGTTRVRPGPAVAGCARADDRYRFGAGGEHFRGPSGRGAVRRHPAGGAHRWGPHPSDALVGPIADIAIRSLHVDLLFLGCHGIDRRPA